MLQETASEQLTGQSWLVISVQKAFKRECDLLHYANISLLL